MLNIDIDVLQQCWEEQKKFLRDGLVKGDIWDSSTGLSIAGHDGSPEVSAFFNGLTENLKDTLDGSGFPALDKFYILNLEGDQMFVVINHSGKLLQGMLLDPKKVNMGILFTVAVPKALAKVKDAFQ